ncbi:phage major capsid protein [bacterium]|nr:phage major capsid protein [bacterium]
MSTVKIKTLHREFALDLAREGAIDEEARTVEVSFSSEEPVERYFGTEILDHSPDSVRLGRLQNGGAVLVDHDRKDHVGVVESATIDADRRGRAKLRLGRGKRASEIFDDVKDGIRTLVSVGYRIYEIVEKSKEGIVRATDWEPYEISFVSIPADATAAVGREVEEAEYEVKVTCSEPKPLKPITEDRTMSDEKKSTPAEQKVDVDAIQAEARRAEQTRIREITALGSRHEMASMAETFVADGKSVEDFRKAALDEIDNRAAALENQKPTTRVSVTSDPAESGNRTIEEQMPATMVGLTGRETGEYSLMRAIRASATNNWKDAGFERECSVAIGDQLGRDAQGFFVPWEVQAHVPNLGMGRAAPMSVATAGEGGYLKGTDHLAGSFIEYLYNASVVMQAGATTLTGLVGDVDIPTQAGTATFAWEGEGDASTPGVVATGTVTLAPTTVAGSVSMTRRLMKQSAPSVEAMVLADLVRGAALAIDNAALEGTGANDIPEGVTATTGINTQTIAAAAGTGVPTWAELVGFETATATDNALQGSLAYITTSAIVGGLKTTAKDSGSGIFLMDSVSGTANGYPVYATNHLTAKTILFGNWADLLIGMWGVLDLMPDRATLASSAGLVLWAFQDCDVAVRHATSFCEDTA